MRCPGCQRDNPDGVRFCGECGARLDAPCPACRAANPAGNKFCHQCGGPLGGTPSADERAPRPVSAAPHLAEKVLASRSAIEGERKQVTVLFADVKSSMELLADRDPEDARKLLNPYRGDSERAVPWLERALAVCHASDVQVWLSWIAGALGLAYALVGRGAEAPPLRP